MPSPVDETPAPTAQPALDERAAGPWPVQQTEIALDRAPRQGECRATVERYAPHGEPPPARTVLVFAHGFLRDAARHREQARHVAGWGVPVLLVGLCPGGWWNAPGDEARGAALFAQLLRQAADLEDATAVVYGGFSAGARAAWLAARDDPRSVGWLGLDPVGRPTPRGTNLPFPVYALFAPAQRCNAQQVGRSLVPDAPQGQAEELPGSTHCHFEWPSNLLCRLACGESGDAARDEALRRDITARATAYVRWRAGLRPDAPPASP